MLAFGHSHPNAMKNLPLNPRKVPRQARSRATCDAILAAAARILERQGDEALNTNRVAEVAGVSIGSLYQYYPTKEAILAELIRAMRQQMHDDMAAAARVAAGSGLEQEVDALVAATLRHHLRNPELAYALEIVEERLPLDAETAALKQGMRTLVVDMLERNGITDAPAIAFDLIAIGHGLADAAIAAGERDFDGLHRRIRRAVLGYLGRPRL
ncbi:TetR/AcrR family transcriptional regulator [Citreimonas salinaria]|uniref:Transcriptional regulator, TetR family n=1 Tax=Citreimonas salinaria TaxID=321339 RepID=A0A1H3P5I8_9RHOB|nr:TetR/AcrR family transcriptional regulator [Citreimonas salinaria]SDY96290.1 transcriptional regulator, TetR family [Citreimonas salinaria]